jgi:hypothetical protein
VRVDRFIKLYILGFKKYVRTKARKKLGEFIDREYPEVVEYARRLMCPFCGRRYANKRSLMRHLYGGRCGSSFSNLVNEIIDRYVKEVKGYEAG